MSGEGTRLTHEDRQSFLGHSVLSVPVSVSVVFCQEAGSFPIGLVTYVTGECAVTSVYLYPGCFPLGKVLEATAFGTLVIITLFYNTLPLLHLLSRDLVFSFLILILVILVYCSSGTYLPYTIITSPAALILSFYAVLVSFSSL